MIRTNFCRYSIAVYDHELLNHTLKNLHINLPIDGAGDLALSALFCVSWVSAMAKSGLLCPVRP